MAKYELIRCKLCDVYIHLYEERVHNFYTHGLVYTRNILPKKVRKRYRTVFVCKDCNHDGWIEENDSNCECLCHVKVVADFTY
jgi:predicted metal-binding protein